MIRNGPESVTIWSQTGEVLLDRLIRQQQRRPEGNLPILRPEEWGTLCAVK